LVISERDVDDVDDDDDDDVDDVDDDDDDDDDDLGVVTSWRSEIGLFIESGRVLAVDVLGDVKARVDLVVVTAKTQAAARTVGIEQENDTMMKIGNVFL